MGVAENLPLKKMVPIFIVTFFLVFILFTMVEPNIQCDDDPDAIIPDCTVTEIGGDFILGIFLCGIFFLVDMGIVYAVLSDLMMGE